MKVEVELPRAGLPIDREVQEVRWGNPKEGEWFLATSEGKWVTAAYRCKEWKLIATLKPLETWVPATVEDVIEALRGKEIRCRGWDGLSIYKQEGLLAGLTPGVIYPWGIKVGGGVRVYGNCEVLTVCK